MLAAIYARKSTDQNVSDEEKSVAVTRQTPGGSPSGEAGHD